MHLQYTFLLTDFYTNEFIPEPLESGSVVVPANKLLWEEKAYYFQKLYTISTTFCFGFFQADLGWEDAELSHVRDSLSLYFFLPNYAKYAGAYLLVSDLDTRRSHGVMDTIQGLLETQGITPLSVNYTVKGSHINPLNKYYYYSNELIEAFNNESASIDFSALFQRIVAEGCVNKQIIVTVNSEEDYKRKLGIINDFEQWMLNNQKAYIDLLSVSNEINNAYLKLKVDNEKLRFRLDNHNDYLKAVRKIAQWHVDEYLRMHRELQTRTQPYDSPISASTVSPSSPSIIYTYDEALQKELESLKSNRDAVVDWYNKEYEVLPLWYKRFGHIIKVMKGKRSFKSLYK